MVPFSVIVQRMVKCLSILIIVTAPVLAGHRETTASQNLLKRNMSVCTFITVGIETGAFGMIYFGNPLRSWVLYVFGGMATLSNFVDTLNYIYSGTDEHKTKARVVESMTVASCSLGVGVLTATANKTFSGTKSSKTTNVIFLECALGLMVVVFQCILIFEVFSEVFLRLACRWQEIVTE